VDKRCPNHVVSPIHVEFKSVSEPEDSNILYIHRKPIRYTLVKHSSRVNRNRSLYTNCPELGWATTFGPCMFVKSIRVLSRGSWTTLNYLYSVVTAPLGFGFLLDTIYTYSFVIHRFVRSL
jgi:hypothetical protein